MPETIGRYQILEELGRGQMGAVYRARDPQIDRVVAIKVILTNRLSPEEVAQYKERFRREAQAAGRMSHPGIITIHDISEDTDGEPYLVMEFVEGTSLDRLLPAGAERWPMARTLDLIRQVALALDYAHQRGVVHRDIKPANILVTPEGRAKIADFGVAKMLGTQTTQSGNLIGTPAFMSPEQFSGSAVDARSDLFSLGSVLYWMCTGEKPFPGDTLTAVSFKVVYAAPLPANQLNTSLPADVVTLLDRCLAKNPGGRYASCAVLAADLDAIAAGQPIAEQPRPAPPGVQTMPTGASPAAGPETGASETVVRTGTVAIPKRRRGAGIIAIGALALACTAGLLWWWRQQPPAPPKETVSATAPSPPNKVGAEGSNAEKARNTSPAKAGGAGTGAAGSSKTPEPGGETKPAPMSSLHVICEHNFHTAKLEILVGDQPLIAVSLLGKKSVFGVYHGKWQTDKPVPAGARVLRVRVQSEEAKYSGEGTIAGTFNEASPRTLLIEFGSGSGMGVSKRKMALSWR
jgi:hypothetical protein